jgi:hypothetical protein
MTHRERHTSEEAPARDATWTPPVSPSASAPSFGSAAAVDLGDASVWADWYHRASAAQQQEALLRAMHQGIVYAHQLTAPAGTAAPVRSLLSSLLNGQINEMAPLHPPALEYHDGELDRMQREAVARAVATPDVCLIQGLPGTGKSRLVVEIVLQAAKRGERILFLAPTAAALDDVLERLSQHPAVCPVRCLATTENPADLPAASARLTLPERLRAYREITVPAARAARDAARQALEVRLREQAHWPQLESLAERHEQLSQRLRILNEGREEVAAEVERLELSALFGESWRACQRLRTEAMEAIDSQLAGLQAELETIAGKQSQLDGEWETIRPLAEARQGWRLWTGAWWRALFQSGLREQANDLEERRAELGAARQRLEQELTARKNERAEIENRFAAECRRLQDQEIARRRAELDNEIAALTHQQNALSEQWRTACAALAGEIVPAAMSRQAVASSRAAWEQLRQQNAQRASAAEQWLQTVEESEQALPEKLAGCANVIAATTAALPGAGGAGDPCLAPVFDLLILEQTHQMTEPEFAAAARRARRWVLIGEPQADGERPALAGWSSLNQPANAGRSPRHFFQRLWQHLHADPCRLPFAWMRRDDRLLCRLRSLTAGQEKWIETEPVVDRPDIELRILSIPRQPPRIVEVAFPACMDLSEAKQFIFRELEELAVHTRGRGLCWYETAEEVILEFAPIVDGQTITVALETGIRERVVGLLAENPSAANGVLEGLTCSLEFSRAAGWTLQRAEEWVAERLGFRSLGRTVLLTARYRLEPSPPPSEPSCPACQKNKTTDNTNNTDSNKRGMKMRKSRGRRD